MTIEELFTLIKIILVIPWIAFGFICIYWLKEKCDRDHNAEMMRQYQVLNPEYDDF